MLMKFKVLLWTKKARWCTVSLESGMKDSTVELGLQRNVYGGQVKMHWFISVA